MATLLFLGASVSQVPGIRYAKARGHRVVACDGDPNAVGFSLCDVPVTVDFNDVDRVTEVGRAERVDGVLAVCTDRAVVPAALVARRLGLPGLDPEVARVMTDKLRMRERLTLCGVPQPPHVGVSGEAPPDWSAFPAVLKPVDSGGQRGIYRVESATEVEELLPSVLGASRRGHAILEEYVEGAEVNTLFAVRGGVPTLLAISDRLRPGGIGFGVGWIHRFPSDLAPAVLEQVEETAARAIRCLGMQDGIAFPQLLVGDSGPMVVEVAARIAAGQMADLVRHATGIDVYDIAIRQVLGAGVPDDAVTPSRAQPVAIRFLTAAPGVLPVGTVTSISGLDEVRAAVGVLDAGVYFRPGTTIGPLQVDADRRGYVIATAATAGEAIDRADAAGRLLRVTVETDRRARPGRAPRRALSVALVCLVLAASVAAFVVAERAKLERPLVLGTRVSKTFSPTCGCSEDAARITFRLMRRADVGIRILAASGATVAVLVRPRLHPLGVIRVAWNGLTTKHLLARTGTYLPDVFFPALHRSLELPSSIFLDRRRPQIVAASVREIRAGLTLRYRFSEPARAVLLVDGRRAVVTRFSPVSGDLRWSGRFASGAKPPRGVLRLGLVAIDPAGNRSRIRRLSAT